MLYFCTRIYMVVVAQLVRALVCGTRGRGFESRLPPLHEKPHLVRLFYAQNF